ncbi:MAG: TatD family hydrolase [Firmicutes bacterium]|nr:TatD family hydrolase [Bacillota bacterium]
MYFESHAHYDDKQFNKDRQTLLECLPQYGVDVVINSGSDLESSYVGKQLSEQYDYIYFAAGVHPHELYHMSEKTIQEIRQLAEHKKCVAIGEIGLDYHYDTFPKQTQKYWFEKQLSLAKLLHIPVIIHSREASQDCFDIIKKSGVEKGVIHCYSGSVEMAEEYVKMGFMIGIGGVLTYSNAKKLTEVAKKISLEHILIETDSPYLSPVPYRGKRNDSRNLEFVVKKLSEIKGLTPLEIANATLKNGKNLFFS